MVTRCWLSDIAMQGQALCYLLVKHWICMLEVSMYLSDWYLFLHHHGAHMIWFVTLSELVTLKKHSSKWHCFQNFCISNRCLRKLAAWTPLWAYQKILLTSLVVFMCLSAWYFPEKCFRNGFEVCWLGTNLSLFNVWFHAIWLKIRKYKINSKIVF